MTLRQHIWNYFVSSKRLEEAWKEAELPNSGLQIYLTVIRRTYPNNHNEILGILSELSVVSDLPKINNKLFQKIQALSTEEKFCDALLLPKIEQKTVNHIIKKFSTVNFINSHKRFGDTVWTIPANFFDVEIEFEKFGKYKGLRYTLRVFPKGSKRMCSTCLFTFCCESLFGYNVGSWDLIFYEGDLDTALNILLKNCQCIHEALDSYPC
jgi:hypothetical protein